jgi:ABC-type transport system involved in multi-copper enzyme maturation permease subunit
MMFLRLLTIETRKTLKHPALWLGLAALLFLFGIFTLISHLQIANGYRTESGGLEMDLISGLAFFNWIGVLVYAVTASVIAAFDYPDRSIQLWLTRGVTRPILLIARLTVILFFGLAMICFAVAALLGLGALSRTLIFGVVDASDLNWSALLPVILRVFWGAVPYLALTVLFAIVSRSPIFAAGGTIVYGSVLERLAMQASHKFPALVRYLPASWSQVLQTFNAAIDRTSLPLPADPASMPETRAILMIGILFIALTATSLVIFSRQDLGG